MKPISQLPTPGAVELAAHTADKQPTASTGAVVGTNALFGNRRELVIEHAGMQYRLRITRNNKLILTK